MIEFQTAALKEISSQHGLSEQELSQVYDRIPQYLEQIKGRNQGFFADHVLQNQELVNEIQSFADEVKGKYDHIVILGIGGSALGPIALRESFGNTFTGSKPELMVIDNIDPDFIAEAENHINLKKSLFLVITKSGGTPETLSQYFYFSDKVRQAGLSENDHFVFVTDSEKGLLREKAIARGTKTFPIPADVGGRFSVLTAVGLLPAALIGIDIEKLLKGAREMRTQFLSEDPKKNDPFLLAAIQYLLLKKGKSQNVMYPYSQKLFRMADWFRQLLAESTGKRYSEDGKEIFTGLTPIAALGATDQHSQNQLYFEGPNDKFFLFLTPDSFKNTLGIPLPEADDSRFSYLRNAEFGQLLHLEMEGTLGALKETDRPYAVIRIPEVSEQSIGELFLLFEGATAFLGEFLNINAFDQPGVELSKNITKKLLLER